MRTCGECDPLTLTAPTQVFLLCTFWAGRVEQAIVDEVGEDYMCGHCHVQPEALACPYFQRERAVAP